MTVFVLGYFWMEIWTERYCDVSTAKDSSHSQRLWGPSSATVHRGLSLAHCRCLFARQLLPLNSRLPCSQHGPLCVFACENYLGSLISEPYWPQGHLGIAAIPHGKLQWVVRLILGFPLMTEGYLLPPGYYHFHEPHNWNGLPAVRSCRVLSQ